MESYLYFVVDTTKNFNGRFIESGWDYRGDAHDRYKELRETFDDRFQVVGLGAMLKHGIDSRREDHWIVGAVA